MFLVYANLTLQPPVTFPIIVEEKVPNGDISAVLFAGVQDLKFS